MRRLLCNKIFEIYGLGVVGPAGIEPATLGLEIRCSIRLSYGPSINQLYSLGGFPGKYGHRTAADSGWRCQSWPSGQLQYRTASRPLRVDGEVPGELFRHRTSSRC